MLNYSGARYVQQYNHSIINITSMLNMSLVSHSVTPKLLQCLGCITAIMAYCNTWSSAVCLSVCQSISQFICWSHLWALWKFLNQSRCHLLAELHRPKKSCIRWWCRYRGGRGNVLGCPPYWKLCWACAAVYAKTTEPLEIPFGGLTDGPKEACIRWGLRSDESIYNVRDNYSAITAHRWAPRKRLNQSRCRLRAWVTWAQGTMR